MSKPKPHELVKGWPKLTPVQGSYLCLYSVVENKLAQLSDNQQKLMQVLELIYDKLGEVRVQDR